MTIHQLRAPIRSRHAQPCANQGHFDFEGESQQENSMIKGSTFLELLSSINGSSVAVVQIGNSFELSSALRLTHDALAAKEIASLVLDPAKTTSDLELRRTLRHLAESLVAKAAHSIVVEDPILGPLSKATSIGSKVQKYHGLKLPKALAHILQFHGLTVWVHPKVALPTSLVDLARINDIESLKKLKVKSSAEERFEYETDLIVYCPQTGWIAAFDGKRGGGPSDSTAKDDLIPKLKALILLLPNWAREKRLQPSVSDTRVIDFFGSSSFPGNIAVRGWDLDAYFGCDVESHLGYFNACCRIAAAKLIAVDGLVSTEATSDPEDLMDHVRPKRLQSTPDLFETDENFHPSIDRWSESRAAALGRFKVGMAA